MVSMTQVKTKTSQVIDQIRSNGPMTVAQLDTAVGFDTHHIVNNMVTRGLLVGADVPNARFKVYEILPSAVSYSRSILTPNMVKTMNRRGPMPSKSIMVVLPKNSGVEKVFQYGLANLKSIRTVKGQTIIHAPATAENENQLKIILANMRNEGMSVDASIVERKTTIGVAKLL